MGIGPWAQSPINQIENKKTHKLNINDIFEEDKEIIKYNFKIFDFKNNESIKTRNMRLFILIKKSNAYDKVLKYMFYLKICRSCEMKFYENQSFYFMSYGNF